MAAAPSRKKADLKVVILGDSAVGKTSLTQRYIEGIFNEKGAHTIGASFFLKQWGPYNVAFWDTAGEERYAGLSNFYCRGANAAILAYDICSSESFESLWARFLAYLDSAEGCLKVVVGTKTDLIGKDSPRQVTYEEGKNFAEEVNEKLEKYKLAHTAFFETSSLTGENVQKVYEFVLETCLPLTNEQKGQANGKFGQSTVILSDAEPNRKKCC